MNVRAYAKRTPYEQTKALEDLVRTLKSVEPKVCYRIPETLYIQYTGAELRPADPEVLKILKEALKDSIRMLYGYEEENVSRVLKEALENTPRDAVLALLSTATDRTVVAWKYTPETTVHTHGGSCPQNLPRQRGV